MNSDLSHDATSKSTPKKRGILKKIVGAFAFVLAFVCILRACFGGGLESLGTISGIKIEGDSRIPPMVEHTVFKNDLTICFGEALKRYIDTWNAEMARWTPDSFVKKLEGRERDYFRDYGMIEEFSLPTDVSYRWVVDPTSTNIARVRLVCDVTRANFAIIERRNVHRKDDTRETVEPVIFWVNKDNGKIVKTEGTVHQIYSCLGVFLTGLESSSFVRRIKEEK